MNSLLCKLSRSMDRIFAWLVSDNFHTFTRIWLLVTVTSYHVKLANFILKIEKQKDEVLKQFLQIVLNQRKIEKLKIRNRVT